MQRGAWLFKLKAGKEEEYRRAHQEVWPELIRAAREAGLRNHSVFVAGDSVFAYAEAEDLETALARLDAVQVTRDWNAAMAELMEDVNGARMDEVFYLD
jgi:L-rhamnose mutarotase